MQRFFNVSLLLLSLCFSSESLGYLPHPMYQFFGLFFLLLFGLTCYPFGAKIESASRFFSAWGLLLLSAFFFQGEILFRISGTVLVLCAVWLFIRSKDADDPVFLPLIATTALYFWFLLLHLYSPPFGHAIRQFSLTFSTAVSGLSGDPVILSATYLGIPITALFLIFIGISFFSSKEKKWGFFASSLFLLLLVNGAYLMVLGKLPALFAAMSGFAKPEGNFLQAFLAFLSQADYPLPNFNFLMNAPVLLFVLCLIPLCTILLKKEFDAFSFGFAQVEKKGFYIFLIMILAATSVLTIELPGKPSPKKEVVLYKEGFLNWSTPNFKNFGSRSAGMFGNLPGFLSTMGLSPRLTDTLSADNLKNARMLMMINVDHELPRDHMEAIWRFVEDGGSLLILGEHTFYKHGSKRVIFNDILQPFDVSVNFDSADWFVGGWLHSYQYASHPITLGMKDDMNDPGIVIGASLRAEPPAFPLIIGKYGYSDPGDINAGGSRGHLGSMNYEPGEPLGDVVLCAAQHYGKGKVLVFGDTSGFVNAIMVKNPDFMNRVFTWLAKDESPKKHGIALASAIIFFVLALLSCISDRPSPFTFLVSVSLSLGIIMAANAWKQHGAHTDIYGKIAYIDVSHGERFSPESWNDNAAMGIYLNLMRNGYQTLSLETFEPRKLNTADLLVLIAPSQPFTPKEIERIRNFVFSGGHLFLSVGWEEKEASESLMAQFGLAVDNIPLGRFVSVIPHFKQKVMFLEAWPVLSLDGEAKVIASYGKLPVIMRRHYGEGQVILIGDSSFFWNKNLEMEKSHVQENVQFLKWLTGNLESGT